jgi:hypothetical protein
VITVSTFDTPAYTGGEVPEDLLLLVSPEWVEERKVRWDVTRSIYSRRPWANSPTSDDSLILQSGSRPHRSERSTTLAARPSLPTSLVSPRTRL